MNESFIWKKLINAGLSPSGAAGLMGNLKAESGLNPKNLQNSYENKLGYMDDSYTDAVDAGTYRNFAFDQAGYGLAQWTFWLRKFDLLEYAKKNKKSIGDLGMQVEFLVKELKEDYPKVWNILCKTTNVREASNLVLTEYEKPADQRANVKEYRYKQSIEIYNMFHKENTKLKSVEELAIEVISGKWGNSYERKRNLTNAGYNYDEVQRKVNEILKSN